MGDYNNQGYPPPPPQGTPAPAPQPGFDWSSLLQQLAPANAIPSLLHFLVPGLSGFMDQVANDQAIRRTQAIGAYAHLAQSPEFNAMLYGQYPQGIPPSPWPTVPATGGAPGGAGGGPFPGAPGGTPPGLRPQDMNRLQVQGPSSALPGYQPTNYPGPGMPPRVLTQEDTKTQLNSAEAEAWRRYNSGGAGTAAAPYFAPVIGTPGHYLYLNDVKPNAKGTWVPDYRATPPLRPATGLTAQPPTPDQLTHPDSHGAGPPGSNVGGGPPPNQPQGRGLTVGGPLHSGEQVPPFTDMETGEPVPGGLAGTDGMSIRGFNQKDYVRDPATGQIFPAPNQNQTATNTPTSTTTTPTSTSTSTTARQIGTTTSQPPRTLSTTTSTLPPAPAAGGAVAAPGASGEVSSSPPGPASPPGSAGTTSTTLSPDMQRLDAIPAPWEQQGGTSTTQTPTTTAPASTVPPTSTTQTPTSTVPPTTARPADALTFPLGPHPARPEQGAGTSPFPLGPAGQPRTGSPSPAFQPPGERAGLAVGQAVGTAPGAETPAEPSIVSRALGALGPAEAQAGGPPGGPGGAAETQPAPDAAEPTPDVPTSEVQPAVSMRADVAQAIAHNTNGIQWYLTKKYGAQYPNINDIPDAVLLHDGVAVDAGRQIEQARTIDMARARAQATPEERAKMDAADTAYKRLYQLYLVNIGNSNIKGLDASIPTPSGPGMDRFYSELGPFAKELSEAGGPVGWIGHTLHAASRSGAGLPNAPTPMESVEQMAGRGGIPGQAATNFLQGHLVAIPIARALGASGRVNQRELALIQQYLIPATDSFYEANYGKLTNTLSVLDAIRRGYSVDQAKTGVTLMSGPDGEPHLVELGGGTSPAEGNPNIAVPGPIGGNQSQVPPQGRMIGR